MANLKIVIPAQDFDPFKYTDLDTCYLADALHKAGFKQAVVGGDGNTWLYGSREKTDVPGAMGKWLPYTHRTKEPFNIKVVEDAFKEGKSIEVELIPIN